MGQESLFELLFGPQASMASSFIASDDIHFLKALDPDPSQLTKCDAGIKNNPENLILSICFFVCLFYKHALD